MKLVTQTLSIVRALTAAWHFLGAALLFVLAAWIVGPVAHFALLGDVLAVIIACGGLQWVRRGCEELALNAPRRPQ